MPAKWSRATASPKLLICCETPSTASQSPMFICAELTPSFRTLSGISRDDASACCRAGGCERRRPATGCTSKDTLGVRLKQLVPSRYK